MPGYGIAQTEWLAHQKPARMLTGYYESQASAKEAAAHSLRGFHGKRQTYKGCGHHPLVVDRSSS